MGSTLLTACAASAWAPLALAVAAEVLVAGLSAHERHAVFAGTAREWNGLE